MKVRIERDRYGSMILKHGRFLEWFIQSEDDQEELDLSTKARNLLDEGWSVETKIDESYIDFFDDVRASDPAYEYCDSRDTFVKVR